MTNLMAARLQMAFSLGFHMLFAAVGVGMPLLMLMAEGMHLRTGDESYRRLAQTWAKATGVMFAVGAVSGTVLSFELGLLWPRFMEFAGSTVGPAFTMEGFAFFIEAIFIGLYLYGWERLSPRAHWLAGIPIAIAGAASSVLVVAANAWQQNPVGADLLSTNPAALNPLHALFANPTWYIMALHSTLATYAATGFAVGGVYAWRALRGHRERLTYCGLRLALLVGAVAALAMPVTGHISAQNVARSQPTKLAAMESQFQTEKGAPLRIGGIPDVANRTVRYAIEIPGGLSFLAFTDFTAEIQGLDRVPQSDWPNVPLMHFSFQIMVGLGFAMVGVAAWYWLSVRKRGPGVLRNRPLMWGLLLASPFGYLSLETGWIVTEVGRQPWIVNQVMRTSDSVTPVSGIMVTFTSFLVLYLLLTVSLVWLLRHLRHSQGYEEG